jgi:hypothetical protein
MECNLGTVDRIIRIIIGLAIIVVLGFFFESWWGLVGILPIFAAVTGKCPLYSIFGISTLKKAEVSGK